MAAQFFKQCFIKTLINRALCMPKRCNFRKVSNIIDSALPTVIIPDLTISEYVLHNCSAWPNNIAVECSATGKKFTYEEIRQKSVNLDKALRGRLKLEKGDVVAVVLPNVPEYPICVLGALQAGLIVTTINPMHMPHEIKRQLEETNAKAIITLNTLWITVKVATKFIPKNIPVLVIKTRNDEELPLEAIKFEEFINTEFDIEKASRPNPMDVALISYSSGTTGLPRGVELTHRNVVANLCQIQVPNVKAAYNMSDNYQDVILDVITWCHSYGLTAVLFNHLYNTNKIICVSKFSPEKFIVALAQCKPSHLYISPLIVTFMSDDAMVKKEYLQSLRNVTLVKGYMSVQTEERFLYKTNKYVSIQQVYMMAETTSFVFMTSPTLDEPLSNTSVKIVSTDNVGTKTSGELYIRGPQVMKGYHNRPKDTEAVLVNGWLRTEDLICYDEYKKCSIRGRLNEVINVKGNKVLSTELEKILRSHPHVVDAAVIGIPHSMYGQVPKAYVVAESTGMLYEAELQAFVADQLIDYKHIIGGITFVSSLPKNAFGDVVKRYLKLQD